jgi:hypothetical protein
MKRALRCPCCRSRAIQIRERSRAFTFFEQDATGVIEVDGIHEHGSIDGIDKAKCRGCKYEWIPRGLSQITDCIGYPK